MYMDRCALDLLFRIRHAKIAWRAFFVLIVIHDLKWFDMTFGCVQIFKSFYLDSTLETKAKLKCPAPQLSLSDFDIYTFPSRENAHDMNAKQEVKIIPFKGIYT